MQCMKYLDLIILLKYLQNHDLVQAICHKISCNLHVLIFHLTVQSDIIVLFISFGDLVFLLFIHGLVFIVFILRAVLLLAHLLRVADFILLFYTFCMAVMQIYANLMSLNII